MRILIDTNILLEGILAQEKADEAKALLEKTEEHDFFISDYTLHSIGLLLFRRKQHNVFRQFLTDMIFIAGMRMIILSAEDMEVVINASQRFKLDFDDAYQYVVAEKYNLTIVSFDTDFDRTDRGRKTPAQILS
jgi:hypothetical protein